MKRIGRIIARSLFRRGLDIFYLHNGEYILVDDFERKDYYKGCSMHPRKGHSFQFSTAKIKKDRGVKRLAYYIK